MKKPEQAASHQRGAYHRFLKVFATRIVRRIAKRDPEDAPRRRVLRGFET